ncbi:MAG: type II toxin-antitoxin system RelE/ParE family toxin [Gallionella sp.]|jgi:addiction module RelE/StbE family toxin|nr:type II toxin-antitoxin system RelE/ParE family toxin [Gallionella sp.]MCK9355238.1 type II toxin-antitoxin system RelE/ParE family toxin [Gallionella sp.]
MKIRWTPEAEEERFAIWAYIAENNPEAAARMDVLFSAAAASLAEQPQLGRAGKIAGTRELIPHENYRLVYEVADRTVWILALVHVARLWPPLTP